MDKKEKPYKTIEEMKKYYIVKALEKTKGNRRDAAKMLGISERMLYAKIIQYGLN